MSLQINKQQLTSIASAKNLIKDQAPVTNKKTYFKFDKSFQEKILQAMIMDRAWAVQFNEVLDVNYFEFAYLKLIAGKYVEHFNKYKEFPSTELLLTMIKTDLSNDRDVVLKEQCKQMFIRVEGKKDLGDLKYVKEKALEFCKKAGLQKALEKSVEFIQTEKYEKVVGVIKDALAAGNEQSPGLSLLDDIDARYSETYRKVIPTGIPELDQRKILNGGLGAGEIGFVVAATGCHARGSLLPTFDGKLKAVEDIKVGDKLLGPDGAARNVQKLISGQEQMYEIVPIKGKPFTVNENHILSLVRTNDGSKSAGQVIEISVKDYLKSSKTFKHIHKLYRPEAMEFDVAQGELAVEPYILGLMLGDGYLHPKRIEITTADFEVVSELKEFANANKTGLSIHEKMGSKASGYYFTNGGKHNNPITSKILSLGLLGKKSHNKFIPQQYKTAGISDRLNLLAGLIDSDGYNTGGQGYEFVSKSQKLADDVVFLCQSLGLAAYKKTKAVQGTDYFRISVSGDVNKIPCRISRKVENRPRRQKKSALRTGFKLVKKSVDEFFGFTLDQDHLYVNDDFIVNHNCGKSHVLTHLGSTALLHKKNVVHYTFELNERVLGIRYDSNLTDTDSMDCINNREMVKEYYDKNREKLGRLIIKYFPTGQATTQTLRSHLEKLANKKFVPDLVIVDYAGIMRSADRSDMLRLEIKKVCEELRGFAQELDVPLWTAVQSNKEGSTADVVDLTNLAESYGQAHVADFILGLSRQSAQKSTGFGNIFVAKNRAGMDGIKFAIRLDTARSKLKILTDDEAAQFREESAEDGLSVLRKKFEDIQKNKQG